MDWDTLLSTKRIGEDKQCVDKKDGRTPYESDIDRVTFSNGFRRLSRKTQVHPFSRNDHIHTRLTHSLEVAQVGRSLGKALGVRISGELPEGISCSDLGSIVQAACLAHDIGNPPFGHAGEEAISHWFASNGAKFLDGFKGPTRRDLSRFEGNAQGFRMLTQTENHLFHGGLRITCATLAAFCKYPWSSRTVIDNDKFGAYISEEKILDEIARNTGLVSRANNRWCRHPLAFLTEAADDICYATIDLEDAVELGVLSAEDAYELFLGSLDNSTRDVVRNKFVDKSAHRVNFSRLRGPVFDTLISAALDAFEDKYADIMNGKMKGELISSLDASDPRRMLIVEAKNIGHLHIYTERFKTEIELGCFASFESLLEAFCAAAIESYHHLQSPSEESAISWKSMLVLRQLGTHAPSKDNHPPSQKWSKYLCLRRVLDYVSGMTDNYAHGLSEQLRGIIPNL